MNVSISFEVATDSLATLADDYLCALWHVAQANPAGMQDRAAGQLAEHIGREIIRRFLANTPPLLWAHQGAHADFCEVLRLRNEVQA